MVDVWPFERREDARKTRGERERRGRRRTTTSSCPFVSSLFVQNEMSTDVAWVSQEVLVNQLRIIFPDIHIFLIHF